ncbi:post-GPI attachment to proteins factor 2-like [Symsagittifera roscoffensis]|uniref:post-GPI attachment to proteins factor 2-like n=1 Tax=Symsagittifera roscoffensis TaxID=84072 RepID=UPI00307CB588
MMPIKLANHYFSHVRVSYLHCSGILMCLFMSAVIDQHALTSTSCGPLTYNFIGTISAANNVYPIGLIWQLLNMVTVSLRMFHGFCLYRFLVSKQQKSTQTLSTITYTVYFLECFFLLMVSVIPSDENLEVHCTMFLGFALAAVVHQGCRLREFKLCGKRSPEIAKAYKRLKKICIIGSLLLFVALSFSYLHFISCVSGAYSLFAAFEYMYVIYGNIYFHHKALSAIHELNNCYMFTISSKLVSRKSSSDHVATRTRDEKDEVMMSSIESSVM